MLSLSWLEVTMSCRWQCPVSSIRTDAAGASSELQFDHGTLDDKAGYRPIESSYHPGVYSATDLTIAKSVSTDGAASYFKATYDDA